MNPGLDMEFRRLVNVLERRVETLVDGLLDAFERETDWFVRRPELREPVRALSLASGRAEIAAMRDGTLPDVLDSNDAEFARESARVGAPLTLMIDGYRRGHAAWWQGWFDLVERCEPDPDRRRALLQRGSDFFFAYARRMTELVSEEHLRERDRMLRSHEQRRVHLVNELLAGSDADAADLGYDVEREHLGLVAWGEEAGGFVRELAGLLDRRLLAVRVADRTWWGWLGGARPLSGRALRELDRFRPPAGSGLAVGVEERGLEGFRRTHRQAVDAQRAGLSAGLAVTRYDDVALETLAAGDEAAAREFAARELGSLDSEDARSRRLRETLRAYFEHDQNAAATAAGLGVHEQTVAQRLRAVEERIGRTVASRRAELEVALRLRRYLAPSFLDHDQPRLTRS